MNKFKHLIITRFMCDNFIKNDSNIDITSEEWMEKAIYMAKRHIIATLENQSNKNFDLIFLVNDNISNEYKNRIKSLSDKLYIIVLNLKHFNWYIEDMKRYDYLITSRLDYDDHVYKDCVNDIQSLINMKEDIKIWGLNNGITVIDNENNAYLQRREEYELNKEGFCAPMESLILKRDACKNGYFDIYKLGFHTEVVRNFLAIQSVYMEKDNYKLEDIYYPKDYFGSNIDFIWIRHKNSASYLVFNIMHTSNIKIDISKEELKDKFGYSI